MNLKVLKRITIITELIILALLIVFRGGTELKNMLFYETEAQNVSESGVSKELEKESVKSSAKETEPEDESSLEQYSYAVRNRVKKMSNEEKIAQLFIVTFDELTETENANLAGDKTKSAIEEYPVGGLIFGMNNFVSTEQLFTMMTSQENYMKDRIGMNAIIMKDESLDMIDDLDMVTSREELDSLSLFEAQDASDKEIVKAINKGSCLIYDPKDFRKSYDAVLQAVEDGTISKLTLDTALCEIVSYKNSL